MSLADTVNTVDQTTLGSDASFRRRDAVNQAREFSLLGAFRRRYGDEAVALARHANYEAGFAAGTQALAAADTQDRGLRTAIALKDQWTQGTPVAEINDRRAVYRNGTTCSYWAIWKQAGLPIAVGCDYNGAWSEGFLHAVNPRIRHVRQSWRARGDRVCEDAYELGDE